MNLKKNTAEASLAIESVRVVFLCLLLPVLASATEVPADPGPSEALLARGEVLYQKDCSSCHGDRGLGDGKAAYLLNPKPRNFSELRFRLISTDNEVPTHEDLYQTLSRGMPGSAMPPWGHLPADDLWALVYQVERLAIEERAKILMKDSSKSFEEACESASGLLTPGAAIEIPDDPEVTSESLAHGKELYAKMCASCHDLDGRGLTKTDMVDNSGYPIFARDFTKGIFKGGAQGTDIARRLLAGMPGSPMPSYRPSLQSDQDLWDLTHYVQSFIEPGAQERVTQSQKVVLARRVMGDLGTDPGAIAWAGDDPTYVALMPLWWRNERIEGVQVSAVHNGQSVAIHLSWEDATQNNGPFSHAEFADGAAVQFSEKEDPPFFAMGALGELVNLWHWHPHWQKDLGERGDIETVHSNIAVDIYGSLESPPFGRHSSPSEYSKTDHRPLFLTGWGVKNLISEPAHASPVEDLTAAGFGTLTSQQPDSQNVEGQGVWKNNRWHVLFKRDFEAQNVGDVTFTPGKDMSVAFAVWDGAARDRNGQKSVTIWHRLRLED